MHDELTKVDIKKMQEEIDYRIKVLTPKLKEELSRARAQGDLSENFEYKSAKRELGRNYSRIDYLQRMIATAKVVSTDSAEGTVGLFSKVCLYVEEDDEEMNIVIVTTLRQNSTEGQRSRNSQVLPAGSRHSTGARLPSIARRTWPAVHLEGSRASL